MRVKQTGFDGLLEIELDVFQDERGFGIERFNLAEFEKHGVRVGHFQDYHSRSKPGVIRGLHYQSDPMQGKLIYATKGELWDVLLDIRKDSKTFGKYYQTILKDGSGGKANALWAPKGFAHGFAVLGDQPADVYYKIDSEYVPRNQTGILWSDPGLAIAWPIQDPVVSSKDQMLPKFSDL